MPTQVIAPHGSLTMATAGQAFRALEKIAADTDILIDLSGIERADSSALAFVIAAVQRGKKVGQTIRIASIPDTIKPFVEIYGLGDAFRKLLHPEA